MLKEIKSQQGKVITTYHPTITKKDLDEVVNDLLKSYRSNQKVTVTVSIQ